jgi:formylglycine-generating enzyme required for sulfatase activity
MDQTEVTNEQYQKFLDETKYPAPPNWVGGHFPEGAEKLPVTNVTWEDAMAYARSTGKRLPTKRSGSLQRAARMAGSFPGVTTGPPGVQTVRTNRTRSGKLSPWGSIRKVTVRLVCTIFLETSGNGHPATM